MQKENLKDRKSKKLKHEFNIYKGTRVFRLQASSRIVDIEKYEKNVIIGTRFDCYVYGYW